MVQNIAARVVDYNGIKAINQLNSIKLRQSQLYKNVYQTSHHGQNSCCFEQYLKSVQFLKMMNYSFLL